MREATGRFVAFLDSDDEWLRGKLERQLARMRARDEPWLCGTGYELYRGPNDVHLRVPEFEVVDREILAAGYGFSLGCTLVARRECFQMLGGFDESLPRLEDWDWLLRAAERFRIVVVREALARVHQSPPPAVADVMQSLDRLETAHQARLTAESRRAGRKFAAAVRLERAAATYHDGRHLRALGYFIASLCRYPIRDFGYIGRVARGLRYHRRRRRKRGDATTGRNVADGNAS